jgi:soluble lytic murein transglycosylase-like protein
MNISSIESIQNVFSRMKQIEEFNSNLEKNFLEDIKKRDDSLFSKELKKEIESNPKKNIPDELKAEKLSHNTRPKTINEMIEKESKKNGLEAELVKAVIKAESNFNPKATSNKGAKGLMQLMPSTAEILGVENAYDPYQNIKGGTKYLKDMLNTFKKKDLAIAAYNAGPGAVKKYKGIPPYQETKDYVKKVNSYIEEFR